MNCPQLSLAAQLAEAREQLAEARERRRRLEGRLRDHERRVLEQKKAAEAEKRRVSYARFVLLVTLENLQVDKSNLDTCHLTQGM